jgi:hypothetical protein
MRLAFRLCGTGFLLAFATAAGAQIVAPPGYETIPLVDSFGQPFAPNGLTVSPSGEMATFSNDPNTGAVDLTLYNTWQNGRTALGIATNSNWTFDTDPVFMSPTTVLFGDNTSSSTDNLWEVNFSNPASPVETQITVNGSLPHIEGVVPINSTTALISGQTASAGGLYLDSVDLTKTSNNVTTLQSGIGTGFPGGAGISPAGSDLLVEDALSGEGIIHVFPTSGPASNIPLDAGNGFGAFEVAFDPAGTAFVSTGNTITAVTGIDSASPTVTEFAADANSDPFLTSLSFTGGAFNPGEAGDTGALIVNDATFDGIGEQAYAIIVPEPATIGLLAAFGIVGLSRRRRPTR